MYLPLKEGDARSINSLFGDFPLFNIKSQGTQEPAFIEHFSFGVVVCFSSYNSGIFAAYLECASHTDTIFIRFHCGSNFPALLALRVPEPTYTFQSNRIRSSALFLHVGLIRDESAT